MQPTPHRPSRTGTLQCSLDGSVLTVDQRLAEMLGYETWQAMLDDVLSLDQLFADPFDPTRIRGRIEEALTGDESRWLTAEGTSVWVRTRVHRLPKSGSMDAVLQIDVDETTDRRRLEERLREILDARALERAASNLSHEINQVLTYAIGHAELIAERLPADSLEEAHDDVEALRRAVLDGARITSRLRAMTRSRLVHPATVELDRFLTGALPLIRHLLQERVDLDLETSGPATIYADRAILEEALILLVSAVRDRLGEAREFGLRVVPAAHGCASPDLVAPRLEVSFRSAGSSALDGPDSALDAARARLDEIGGTLTLGEEQGDSAHWTVSFLGPAPEAIQPSSVDL